MSDVIKRVSDMSSRRGGLLAVVLALSLVGLATPVPVHATEPAQQVASAQYQGLVEQYRMVRDEAIAEIGWMTGNAKGTPAWQNISKYTAEGGKYYKFLMYLRAPGTDQKAEWEHNVKVYNAAYEQGRHQKFDAAESERHAKKLGPLFQRITSIHKKLEALENTNPAASR